MEKLELLNCLSLQERYSLSHDKMLVKDGGKVLIRQVKRASFLLHTWR
jgi:hypothetical protein